MYFLVPFLVVLSWNVMGSSSSTWSPSVTTTMIAEEDHSRRMWFTTDTATEEPMAELDTEIQITDNGLPRLEARLVNGPNNATGRVEVRYNGTWGTVCDDGWDLNDANVVCRMVGFYRASSAPVMARYGQGSGIILLDEVWCRGSEKSLEECSKNDYGVHNCDHSEDAGALCETTEEEEYETQSWSAIEIDQWPVAQPEIWIPSTRNSDLEARIVNGANNSSGRVEILHNGLWGTVCDDGWDLNDAHVVCRMLGFPKASSAPVMATYGQGTVDILLDDVQCSGSEYSLEDCQKKDYGDHNCGHDEDAGVICTEPVSLQVRLANGPNNNTGRVEVMNGASWGTVCDDYWDPQDANVVCRMLGFFGAAYAPVRATYGEGVGDILLQNVDCMGTEHNLGTCFYDIPELYVCAHDEDAGVACLDFISDFAESTDPSLNGAISLSCHDLESTTDTGLATSSNVIIKPRVLHDGNQNVSVGCTYTSQDSFDYGDTWVACAVRDVVGNYATCNFTVTIRDGEPPRLNCPELINATTDHGRRFASNVVVIPPVTDNTDPSPSVSCTPGSAFLYGNHPVTCNATDQSGNFATCSLNVSVTDKDPPQITCSDRTVIPDPKDSANFIPHVTDNIDPNPSIDCSPGDILGYNVGNSPTISCDASDSEGNTATCSFSVTIQNPCTALRPCINGACTYEGSGRYQCHCSHGYEGPHCDVIHEPKLPVEVDRHPQNQTVVMDSSVVLTCSFNNAESYEWYKDGNPVPILTNETILRIQSVNASHIGYYFCRGYGSERSSSIDTKRASIYIEGLVKIEVSNLKFNFTSAAEHFPSQIASTIRDFVLESLENYIKDVYLPGHTSMSLDMFKDLSPEVICSTSSFNQRETFIYVEVTVYITNTDLTAIEERDLVKNALEAAANMSNSILDASSMDTQNTAICKQALWDSPYGRVRFPEGENGTPANSSLSKTCPFNRTNADGAVGRAECIGDLISQSVWLPRDNCGSIRNVSDLLTDLAKETISDDNVIEFTEQVDNVTSNTAGIESGDISKIANIIHAITNVSNVALGDDSEREQVTGTMVSILSNIIEVDPAILVSAESSDEGTLNGIVEAFQEQVKNIPVQGAGADESVSIVQPNIAVKVQGVQQEDIRQNGIVLTVATDNTDDLSKSETTIKTSKEVDDDDKDDDESADKETLAVVNIPSEVSNIISPKDNETEYVNVFFVVFSTPSLFVSKTLENVSHDSPEPMRAANTPVISLSIGEEKIENLTNPINFTFTPLKPKQTNPSCVYWKVDGDSGDWSNEGCTVLSMTGIRSPDEHVNCHDPLTEKIVCGCTHLTNFAVLMDVYREDRSSDQAYKMLTYIGCSLSIISLLITLATYLTNKVLREKQTNKIFICLCVTLLCLYISFIVMMTLDTARQECRIKNVGCGLIAGLIHYFVLSSMTWMGVEGYNTYLIIVKIFDTYIEKFMYKAAAVAWGFPAVIVIVTGFSSQEKYIHKDLCFLEVSSQIGGLLIPITIIILVNVVIFALVIRQLKKSSNVAGRVTDAKSERKETIERVQNAICILLLLGLTWITGYFLLIPQFSQIAEPIFIMLNAFQGLFIFLLYCVRKPMVRKQWGLTCLGRGVKRETTLSSSGTHSSKNITLSSANPSSSMSMMSSMSHSMPMEKTPMLGVLEEKHIKISNF